MLAVVLHTVHSSERCMKPSDKWWVSIVVVVVVDVVRSKASETCDGHSEWQRWNWADLFHDDPRQQSMLSHIQTISSTFDSFKKHLTTHLFHYSSLLIVTVNSDYRLSCVIVSVQLLAYGMLNLNLLFLNNNSNNSFLLFGSWDLYTWWHKNDSH